MMPQDLKPFDDDAWQPEPKWQWRKCRNTGVSIAIWPIDWAFGVMSWSDAYAWVGTLNFGPFVFQLNCNVGTPSVPDDSADRLSTQEGGR